MDLTIQTEKDLESIKMPPPILTLVGGPKIGKTTMASKFPSPVILWTERGASGLKVPKLPADGPVNDWTMLLKCVNLIREEKHDRKTLVLDTIDIAQKLAMTHVINEKYKGDAATFEAYKQGYVPLRNEFRRLLKGLGQVRDQRNMNIVVITHQTHHKGASVHGEDYKVLGGNLEKECWEMLRDWSDQIGFAAVKIRAVKQKAQDVGGNKRYLFFDDHPGRMAGCRAGYELPPEILLDFEDYAKHMKGKLSA